jgi:DNA-directed RNA polymerase specialized sigma24 family protein
VERIESDHYRRTAGKAAESSRQKAAGEMLADELVDAVRSHHAPEVMLELVLYAELTDDEREVLIDHHLLGQSLAEVGRTMKRSRNFTAEVNRRAMHKLRRQATAVARARYEVVAA